MFAHLNRRPDARRGFTLIELLVVMSVIAILLSLLVPTIRKIREMINIAQVETMIGGLSMALDIYKNSFGAYPPDRINTSSSTALLDKSSECLVYYLSGGSIFYISGVSDPTYPWRHSLYQDTNTVGSGRKAMQIWYDFKRNMLADQDGDLAPEIIDRWGKSLIYNSGGAKNYNDTPANLYNQYGAPKHMIGKFDMFSAGPDQVYGTADDIRNWGSSPNLPTDYDYSVFNPPNTP